MGASNKHKLRQPQDKLAPVIRKVLHMNGTYTCTLCKSRYDNRDEALECLSHCWREIKDQYPLVRRRVQGIGEVYRCRICCRDYILEEKGMACAQDCIEKNTKKQHLEQDLNDLPIDLPPRPTLKLPDVKRINYKPPVQSMFKKDPKKEKEASNEEAPPVETTEEQGASEEAAPEEKPDNRKEKTYWKKQWIRKNEKYQCSYCKELYYTRVEAQACFDKNFGEDGKELEEGASIEK